MISFAVQRPLNFIGSYLFVFAFISFVSGDRTKKMLLRFMPKSILPMFSSGSFMVSSLTFRSLIYFEFIFVYAVRECSHFIFMCSYSLFPAPLTEDFLFFCLCSIVYSFFLSHRLIDHKCMGLFLGSLIIIS